MRWRFTAVTDAKQWPGFPTPYNHRTSSIGRCENRNDSLRLSRSICSPPTRERLLRCRRLCLTLVKPGLRLLPARQLRNLTRKHSGDKAGHSELHNLFPHSRLHFSHRNIRQNELSLLVTMTAIHRVPRSVSISATSLFIPLQRHPATLAVLIRFIHNLNTEGISLRGSCRARVSNRT